MGRQQRTPSLVSHGASGPWDLRFLWTQSDLSQFKTSLSPSCFYPEIQYLPIALHKKTLIVTFTSHLQGLIPHSFLPLLSPQNLSWESPGDLPARAPGTFGLHIRDFVTASPSTTPSFWKPVSLGFQKPTCCTATPLAQGQAKSSWICPPKTSREEMWAGCGSHLWEFGARIQKSGAWFERGNWSRFCRHVL